jgi:NAD(P)-dependent dehydrogenase (short-subunit alcohol dehydrogenase family)
MIIVSGAAGTLGQAIVGVLAEAKLDVVAVDRSPQIVDAGQRRSLGGVDLTDDSAVAAALETLGDVAFTGLVNVAGGFRWETVADGAWSSWEAMYRLNVQTTYTLCRRALPGLRRGRGAIVNVGAAASARAGAGMGAYAASKAAVSRLTESLAAEELPHGVRVNAVLPVVIDTPPNRATMPDADFASWATPREVAEAVLFLLSSRASGVTGASLVVAGRTL